MNKSFNILLVLALFLSLVGMEFAYAEKKSLVIGKVSSTERQKTYAKLKPMVDFVASQLADEGISSGEVFFANNNQEMIYALLTGQVDWVTDSVFSALIMSEKSGASIELKRIKEGAPDSRSLILVKKDSKITSINDLKGKIIAFEDVGSSTAYFLPYIEFVKKGITPILSGKNTNVSTVNKETVQYVFSGSEYGMVRDLMSGKVDAIAFSDMDHNELLPNLRDKLKIIHGSGSYPKGLELFRADLDENIRKKIQKTLLNIEKNKQAAVAMKKYFKTTKFEPYVETESVARAKIIIQSEVIPLR